MLKIMRRRWAVAAAVALVAIGATLLGSPSFATGTGAVSGTIFGDTDGDGVHDVDEIGIGGVAVWIVADSRGGQRSAVGVRSAGDGSWSVSTGSLGTGPFGVGIGDPIDESGQVVSIESASSVTLPDGLNWTNRGPDHIGRWVTGVAAGTSGLNFGVATCATSDQCVRPQIGGSVWFDADRDGTQGSSERGIPGADVTLLAGGAALASLRTDAGGRWVAGDGSVSGGVGAIDQVSLSVSAAASVGVLGEPGRLIPTEPDVGSDAADSDGVANDDGSATVSLATEGALRVADVGFVAADGDAMPSDGAAADDSSADGSIVGEPAAGVEAERKATRSDGSTAAHVASIQPGLEPIAAISPNGSEGTADVSTERTAAQTAAEGSAGVNTADSAELATPLADGPGLADSAGADGLGSAALALTPVTAATDTAGTAATGQTESVTEASAGGAEPVTPSASTSGREVDLGEFEDELASGDAALGVGELPELADMPVVLPSAGGNFASTLPRTGGNTLRVLGAALMGIGTGAALVSIAAPRRRLFGRTAVLATMESK